MSFTLFGYQRGDDFTGDVGRRRLPRNRVAQAVEWALDQGCEVVLIEQADETPFHTDIVHHVCTDPACPGGC